MEKRRRIIIAVMLLLTVINYFRLQGNENIRLIQFVSIFTIGLLTALLIRENSYFIKAKKMKNSFPHMHYTNLHKKAALSK